MNWNDQTRTIVATVLVAVYVLMCAAIYYAQLRKRQRTLRDAAALIPAADGAQPWLVGYASQTGFAEELAWHTARLLHTAGVPTRVASLSEISASDLSQVERALFVVSTYGEGDPPDNAFLFASKLMNAQLTLPHLHFGVLMLGDSEYANFCGFGRSLTNWLKASGAQALFASIFVDKAANSALQTWQHQLSHIAGTSDAPDWQAPEYEQWRLAARTHLNPDSAGAATFHLELEAIGDTATSWEAGDLVQVLAPDDTQRPREYSIASIPSDGRVHLLVRQERREDGSLGIASGWLTEQAAVGTAITLRLRPHNNFRIGGNAHRPLILIGNGTGLAGLRSHLKSRATTTSRNWLIFGERNAAHDFYYQDEIEAWQSEGNLACADIVFSRDQAERFYVQDKLREQAEQVRAWIAADAAVYVCGSLEGMAGGVEDALTEILGKEIVEQLIAQGRYRRDVY